LSKEKPAIDIIKKFIHPSLSSFILPNLVIVLRVVFYCARQHICYSAYMLTPVRPPVPLSVPLSVCHTGGSVKDG